MNTLSLFIKRLFDIFLSSVGILLSSPLWLLIAIAIKIEDGGPVFYSQERVGKGGKLFKIYKFRSMIKDAEKSTGAVWADKDDPRITRVGRILRQTALDELPQLLVILKGDMSFVGPRPERPQLIKEFRRQIPNYDARLQVKPGLTGLAQVFGNYATLPKNKLRYDLLYIKKQSLGLDIKLIFLSFLISLRRKWEYRGKKFTSKNLFSFIENLSPLVRLRGESKRLACGEERL